MFVARSCFLSGLEKLAVMQQSGNMLNILIVSRVVQGTGEEAKNPLASYEGQMIF